MKEISKYVLFPTAIVICASSACDGNQNNTPSEQNPNDMTIVLSEDGNGNEANDGSTPREEARDDRDGNGPDRNVRFTGASAPGEAGNAGTNPNSSQREQVGDNPGDGTETPGNVSDLMRLTMHSPPAIIAELAITEANAEEYLEGAWTEGLSAEQTNLLEAINAGLSGDETELQGLEGDYREIAELLLDQHDASSSQQSTSQAVSEAAEIQEQLERPSNGQAPTMMLNDGEINRNGDVEGAWNGNYTVQSAEGNLVRVMANRVGGDQEVEFRFIDENQVWVGNFDGTTNEYNGTVFLRDSATR